TTIIHHVELMMKENMAAFHFTSNRKNNSLVSCILPPFISYRLYDNQSPHLCKDAALARHQEIGVL
ncbi:hypothetical protein D5086_025418, partial [Populus alba]